MKITAELQVESGSLDETLKLGARCGSKLMGGEVIELVSDLGGGKTAFVRGLAKGIGSTDQVMSPTFTISRIYESKRLDLHHFDFYRLKDPGIMADELAESIHDDRVAVVVEWGRVVAGVLPEDRLQVNIVATGDNTRTFDISAFGKRSAEIVEALR